MFLANRLLPLLGLLISAIASAPSAAGASPCPKEMPGQAPESAPATPAPHGAADPVNPAATLTSPRAAPAFCSLFVVVMPWNADRYNIEAGRKVQFALRLDEPKEPAFRVTLRF